jgi:Ni/Co efflux regulator RcnB
MKKILTIALAGMMAAATLTPVAPALAQNRGDWCKFGNCDDDGDRDRDRHSSRDWDDDDRDGDRDSWKRYSWNRDRDWDDDWRWRDRDRRWRHRDRDRFDGGEVAAGLVFGLAAGAIAGSVASPYYGSSYERCRAAYRSFNPQTWTYLGYDGYYHRCPY